jgi:hypothetical protein
VQPLSSQPLSSDRKSCGNLLCQFATHWLAVGQYQSIDDTIVQLFVPHTSGFMSLQQSDSIGIRRTGTWKPLRFLFRSVPPSARPGRCAGQDYAGVVLAGSATRDK